MSRHSRQADRTCPRFRRCWRANPVLVEPLLCSSAEGRRRQSLCLWISSLRNHRENTRAFQGERGYILLSTHCPLMDQLQREGTRRPTRILSKDSTQHEMLGIAHAVPAHANQSKPDGSHVNLLDRHVSHATRPLPHHHPTVDIDGLAGNVLCNG